MAVACDLRCSEMHLQHLALSSVSTSLFSYPGCWLCVRMLSVSFWLASVATGFVVDGMATGCPRSRQEIGRSALGGRQHVTLTEGASSPLHVQTRTRATPPLGVSTRHSDKKSPSDEESRVKTTPMSPEARTLTKGKSLGVLSSTVVERGSPTSVLYFAYGANMSPSVLTNKRNVKPLVSLPAQAVRFSTAGGEEEDAPQGSGSSGREREVGEICLSFSHRAGER